VIGHSHGELGRASQRQPVGRGCSQSQRTHRSDETSEWTLLNPLMHKVAKMVTTNHGVRRHTGLTHGF